MKLHNTTAEETGSLLKELNVKLNGRPYTGTTLDFIQDAIEHAFVTYDQEDVRRKAFLSRHDYGVVNPNTDNHFRLYHNDEAIVTVHFNLDTQTGIGSMRFGCVKAIAFHKQGTETA